VLPSSAAKKSAQRALIGSRMANAIAGIVIDRIDGGVDI
jgi:hypothetical protein